MVQGAIKKRKPKPASSLKSDPGSKRGSRTIAPKKAGLVKKKKLDKKLSAGLTTRTERSLAGKAGHLEMLKGGKKDSKKEDKKGGGTKKAGEKVK